MNRPTADKQAEYQRNTRIVRRMVLLRGIPLERAIAVQTNAMNKSAKACKGLPVRAWESTFPKVFRW